VTTWSMKGAVDRGPMPAKMPMVGLMFFGPVAGSVAYSALR
jgi:hypothetical protein